MHRMLIATLSILLLFLPVASGQRGSSSLTPEQILGASSVREGSTVCEIGAGNGDLSVAAARIVGPTGHVYTSELGDNRIQRLKDKIRDSGIRHITVVTGEAERTNFPDTTCDGIFMRDVCHHFGTPTAINRSIVNALKPGGRLVVVDFKPPDRQASQAADRSRDGTHGVLAETVVNELREAGFETVTAEQGNGRWFMVMASKPRQGPQPSSPTNPFIDGSEAPSRQ